MYQFYVNTETSTNIVILSKQYVYNLIQTGYKKFKKQKLIPEPQSMVP